LDNFTVIELKDMAKNNNIDIQIPVDEDLKDAYIMILNNNYSRQDIVKKCANLMRCIKSYEDLVNIASTLYNLAIESHNGDLYSELFQRLASVDLSFKVGEMDAGFLQVLFNILLQVYQSKDSESREKQLSNISLLSHLLRLEVIPLPNAYPIIEHLEKDLEGPLADLCAELLLNLLVVLTPCIHKEVVTNVIEKLKSFDHLSDLVQEVEKKI